MTGKSKDPEIACACEALCIAILARAEAIEAVTVRKPREGLTGYYRVAVAVGEFAGEMAMLAEALDMLARHNDAPSTKTTRRSGV